MYNVTDNINKYSLIMEKKFQTFTKKVSSYTERDAEIMT